MFLNCVGFIADYPDISETIDVFCHTSNVPCHLCYLARYYNYGRDVSAYGYTTDVLTDHPDFCRNEKRLQVLRNKGITKRELRGLGMERSGDYEAILNAFHPLSISLKVVGDLALVLLKAYL